MGRINPLIAIGIPTWGTVSIEWARAYRHLGGPLGSTCVELEPVIGKPIAEARNSLVQQAIAAKAEFLFFLGDDVLCPTNTLSAMLQRLRERPELDLLTGVYWTRTWPTAPYLWRGMQRGPYFDWKQGEFFQVDYAGCDALMIRLSERVVALGPEWFSTTWKWEPDQQVPSTLATEDFYFYTRARKAGIELWVDSTLQCLHQDRQSRQMFGLLTTMPQAGAEEPALPEGSEPDGRVKVLDVGCGYDSPYFGDERRVALTRLDLNEAAKPDIRADVRRIPLPDGSYDLVHSRHVLEHIGRAELKDVVLEWTRVLRVGGELQIRVPNLKSAIEWILKMDAGEVEPHQYPWWQLYGEQVDERDVHKNGFTARRLELLLKMFGVYENVEIVEEDGGLNLLARGTKARNVEEFALTPHWDDIATQEGFVVTGLASLVPPPEAGDPDGGYVFQPPRNGDGEVDVTALPLGEGRVPLEQGPPPSAEARPLAGVAGGPSCAGGVESPAAPPVSPPKE